MRFGGMQHTWKIWETYTKWQSEVLSGIDLFEDSGLNVKIVLILKSFYACVDWFHLAWNKNKKRDHVNAAMDLHLP
jgi:hypothetical protein